MAWKKQIELENGVVIEHWKVTEINANFITGSVVYKYEGYVSKLADEDGKPPVVQKHIEFPIIESQELANAALAFGQHRVQALPEFLGYEEYA